MNGKITIQVNDNMSIKYIDIYYRRPVGQATQQTRDIANVLVQCWSIVCDAGSTLNQHMSNVPCLLCICTLIV